MKVFKKDLFVADMGGLSKFDLWVEMADGCEVIDGRIQLPNGLKLFSDEMWEEEIEG